MHTVTLAVGDNLRLVPRRHPAGRFDMPRAPRGTVQLPHPSRGLAVLPGTCLETTRVYLCDPLKRQIRVLNGRGAVLGAFGSGCGEGSLEWPSDVLMVRPHFPGEQLDSEAPETAWLVVADRGRSRLHVHEPDGTLVGTIGTPSTDSAIEPLEPIECLSPRAGWPYFRLHAAMSLAVPIGLEWREPYVLVTTATGDVERVDLAYQVLPAYRRWLHTATLGELLAARRYFRSKPHAGEISAARLVEIETTLGRQLLAHRQRAHALLIWSSAWPRGTALATRRTTLEERFALVSQEAFRLGRFGPLRDLQRALRVQEADMRRSSGADIPPTLPLAPGARKARRHVRETVMHAADPATATRREG